MRNYWRLSLLQIIAILVLVAFTFSCHKDGGSGNNRPGPNLISSLDFRWSSFNGNGKDVMEFTYDNAGRVTQLFHHTIFPATNTFSDSILLINFEYSGNNPLPKYFYIDGSLYGYGKYKHCLTYNNNGEVILDSVAVYPKPPYPPNPYYLDKISYAYTPSAIIEKDIFDPNNDDSIFLFRSNGNITSTRSVRFPNTFDEVYYDYDNGLNSLNNLNISPIFFVIARVGRIHNGFYSIWSLCNTNNMIRTKGNYIPSQGVYQDTFATLNYFYRPDGLVEKRIWNGIHNRTEDTIYYRYQ